MNKELKNIVKKTAKISGVVCIAAGAVAVMTSKAALQVILEGGKYLKDTVKKIIHEEPAAETAPQEPGEMAQAEVVAEDEDFAEHDSQEEPAAGENI